MKRVLIAFVALQSLNACERAPQTVDPAQMSLSNPGRTADNSWVVGAASLNPDIAEADARLQTARKNCRLIALPGEPPLIPAAEHAAPPYVWVADAPAQAQTPETIRAISYAERYNPVVRNDCAS